MGLGDQVWRRDHLAGTWILTHYLDKILYQSTRSYLEMCDSNMCWWGIVHLNIHGLVWM